MDVGDCRRSKTTRLYVARNEIKKDNKETGINP